MEHLEHPLTKPLLLNEGFQIWESNLRCLFRSLAAKIHLSWIFFLRQCQNLNENERFQCNVCDYENYLQK